MSRMRSTEIVNQPAILCNGIPAKGPVNKRHILLRNVNLDATMMTYYDACTTSSGMHSKILT